MYYDAIIMFHAAGPEAYELVARARWYLNIPVIVDIDDLLDELPADHPHYGGTGGDDLPGILANASQVVVSTNYLLGRYAKYNRRICTIRNSIDPVRYSSAIKGEFARPGHSGFVVGWTGSQTHQPDLAFTGFTEGLDRFMAKYDDVRAHFHLLCPDQLHSKYGVRVTYDLKTADYLSYPGFCSTLPWDICAVPLVVNPFNHAKSDLRLLDMAPFRIPILVSEVDDFVRHKDRGVCLYAENTPQSWFERLKWAYLHKRELGKIADRAHQYVCEQRLATLAAAQWDQLLQVVFRGGLESPKTAEPVGESANPSPCEKSPKASRRPSQKRGSKARKTSRTVKAP